MTDQEIYSKKTAREILSFIEEVSFSKKYLNFRVNHGSNGQRNLIIHFIKSIYLEEEVKYEE